QAEDGIRYWSVTGVQTCALPICRPPWFTLSTVLLLAGPMLCMGAPARANCGAEGCPFVRDSFGANRGRYSFDVRYQNVVQDQLRSEERRVGKECRTRWWSAQ